MKYKLYPDAGRESRQAGREAVPDGRKVLMTASVASMIDLFNRENIRILQSQGWQVDVAANFSFGNITSRRQVALFRQELARMHVRVYDVPVPRRVTDIRNIVRSYHAFRRILAEGNYGLMHTQSPVGGAVSRFAAGESRRCGMKVMYTAHGFHFYKGAPLYRWILFYPVERWLSRHTDVLVVVNEEDRRRAQGFHAGRVCHVPGIGIDLQKYRFCEKTRVRMRNRFGIRCGEFVVLSVGQLSRRKNHETAIRAMALVKNPNVRYVIAGTGEYARQYRQLVRQLGLEGRVFLAGCREDIADVLQMADCFLFPSLQEGLPVSLMEAMAVGVPVVCSRVRGNCDLVRDGVDGKLVEARDARGFAQAVEQLAGSAETADRYRRNAAERVEAFSRERVNRRMEQIYRQACSGRSL